MLSDELVAVFKRLEALRHRAAHYHPGLDNTDARADTLGAVLLVQDIIGKLFAPFGGPPGFIEGTSGQTFLSSESETQPLSGAFTSPRAYWCPRGIGRDQSSEPTEARGSRWTGLRFRFSIFQSTAT